MRNVLLVLVLVAACDSQPTPVLKTAPIVQQATHGHLASGGGVNPRLLRRFKPLRAELVADAPPTPAQVALGRMLFFDKRLSKTGDVSCNSCHSLDRYGVDDESTSVGTKGARGRRNSPSVFNAAADFTSFWDGRAPNVEQQAKAPILNADEMGMGSPAAAVHALAVIPGYLEAFRAAYPADSEITFDNVGRALGAFERELTTPSRWDRYLRGDLAALTSTEIAGLKVFTDVGCITCHTGELVGASMFQKVGVAAPWPNRADRGRYELTKLTADDMVFKVPSLRNIAKTGPYFHDGSVATLPEAVRMMGIYQTGEDLSAKDVDLIVAWLGALTGDLPAALITPPTLPGEPARTALRELRR